MPDLNGRVALVTGASRGIGKGVALALAEAGADVAVNYNRRRESAEQTVAEIESLGRRAIALQADAGDYPAVKAMVEKTVQTFGKLDMVVANGGHYVSNSFFDDGALEDFHGIMSTHLNGYFYTAKAAEPHLRQNPRGDIHFITSLATQQYFADEWAYASAKAAIEALTKCIAKDANRYGIRVNCIAPSITETDMTRDGLAGVVDFDDHTLLQQVPFGRFIQPYDIGKLSVFLASKEGEMISGQVIYVDWGIGPGSIFGYIDPERPKDIRTS